MQFKKYFIVLFLIFSTFNIFAQTKRYSFNFTKVPLSVILKVMAEQTGRKFITDEELGEKIVSLRLQDVSSDEALKALVVSYNLYYVKLEETGIYIIKDRRREPIIGVSKVIKCNYIRAEEFTDVLKPRLTPAGQIKADKMTNSLIINDISDVVAEIEDIVRQLDQPTRQALIEARIVEIKTEKGLKWGLGVSNAYDKNRFWISPLEQKRAEVIKGYEVSKDVLKPEVNFQQLFGDLFGVGGLIKTSIIAGDVNIESFVEALASKGIANIMARPKLLVMNNQKAFIQIVEEVPYQRLTVSEQGNPMVSTEFKQVGVKLSVKPQINSDKSIVLEVAPEQNYRTGEALGGVPIIDTSKTETTFLLKSGETAVIGGLLREIESNSDYKIPFLGDIPIIGFLFKRTVRSKTKSDLTVFITATVVEK